MGNFCNQASSLVVVWYALDAVYLFKVTTYGGGLWRDTAVHVGFFNF